jgi:hypothetical protein
VRRLRDCLARGRHSFAYELLPQYTRYIAPLWENSDLTKQLDMGALAVANETLDLVRAMENIGSDRRRATSTRMRALLDDQAHLPPVSAAA